MAVRGQDRGFRIGAALTREVMDQAAREGAQEFFCLVFKDDRAALNLYNNPGFAPIIIPISDSPSRAKIL